MRRPLLLLALAGLVLATTTEEVEVKCPVCGNTFKAERWNSSNNVGGQDRDFCSHAAGGQVFIISCWTCPGCCYTGSPDDFDPEKAPKELIAKLKQENPLKPAEPIDPKSGDSRKIPPWVRHDLSIQILKLVPEATAMQHASACLNAAHTQRFTWELGADFDEKFNAIWKKAWDALPGDQKGRVNAYVTYVAIARALEAEAADAKADLKDSDRIDRRVVAAVLYKERGEDPDARRVLASLATAGLTAEQKAVVEDIRIRIERERKYLQLAIPYLEEHLAKGKPEAEEAVAIQYLVGALYRRVGDPKKAVAALEPLLAKEGIPDGLLEWIQAEVAKAKAG